MTPTSRNAIGVGNLTDRGRFVSILQWAGFEMVNRAAVPVGRQSMKGGFEALHYAGRVARQSGRQRFLGRCA
jgi:hypothetical protein